MSLQPLLGGHTSLVSRVHTLTVCDADKACYIVREMRYVGKKTRECLYGRETVHVNMIWVFSSPTRLGLP